MRFSSKLSALSVVALLVYDPCYVPLQGSRDFVGRLQLRFISVLSGADAKSMSTSSLITVLADSPEYTQAFL